MTCLIKRMETEEEEDVVVVDLLSAVSCRLLLCIIMVEQVEIVPW